MNAHGGIKLVALVVLGALLGMASAVVQPGTAYAAPANPPPCGTATSCYGHEEYFCKQGVNCIYTTCTATDCPVYTTIGIDCYYCEDEVLPCHPNCTPAPVEDPAAW
jgi:hypothetical protein